MSSIAKNRGKDEGFYECPYCKFYLKCIRNKTITENSRCKDYDDSMAEEIEKLQEVCQDDSENN